MHRQETQTFIHKKQQVFVATDSACSHSSLLVSHNSHSKEEKDALHRKDTSLWPHGVGCVASWLMRSLTCQVLEDPGRAQDPLDVAKAPLFMVLQSAAPIGPTAPSTLHPRDLVGAHAGKLQRAASPWPFGDVAFLVLGQEQNSTSRCRRSTRLPREPHSLSSHY